ncbi:hypothetical protein TNCV_313611 [Trichonephila clavipes]|nr:hypothetical protein TNCV_313611 [Trichonephila clavipes]
MTEILDLTPAMDLDTELTNGMDNNDDRHPMENEPPLPQDDSRPELHTSPTANMRSLKLHGLNDEDCHIMKEHLQRLDNYTALNALTSAQTYLFAQAAAQQEKNKNTAPTPQQMAPRIGQVPTTITAQTQAATTHIAKQQKTSNAKNECMGLITQTLTQTIQALSLLVQQINSIDFSSNTPSTIQCQ